MISNLSSLKFFFFVSIAGSKVKKMNWKERTWLLNMSTIVLSEQQKKELKMGSLDYYVNKIRMKSVPTEKIISPISELLRLHIVSVMINTRLVMNLFFN